MQVSFRCASGPRCQNWLLMGDLCAAYAPLPCRKEVDKGTTTQVWVDAHRIGYNWVPTTREVQLDEAHPVVREMRLNYA